MNIAEIRQKYPQYADIPDGELVRGLHRKFYSDMPYGDFLQKIDFREAAPDPTDGMGPAKLAAAGVGKSMVDTGRGVGQMFGLVSGEDVDEARQLDEALTNTGAGFAGNVAGSMAQIALPGAGLLRGAKALNSAKLAAAGRSALAPTTFKGAGIQGGAFAATQPVASDESRAGNVARGTAGGLFGQGLVKTVGAAARPRVIGLNEQQKRVLAEAEELGFKALPSQRTGSGALRVAEAGLSRTIGGAGAFTGIAKQNQTRLNQLAAKELGRESDTVTRELLDDVQSELGAKYDALRSVKTVKINPGFRQELATLLKEEKAAPDVLQEPEVMKLVESLIGTKQMTGKTFVAATKKLRKQARDAFRSGKSEVGEAKKAIVEALEDYAEPKGASPTAIVDFKKARHRYSKLLSIESAFNERGDVSAAKLAQAFKKQNPKRYGNLSSDLEKAAAFEKMFPPIQSSGSVEGAQALISGGAMLADPSLGLATLAGPFLASRAYATKAGGTLAEAPVRLAQAISRTPQRFLPQTERQKMLAEMLRRGIVPSGAALPAALND